MDQVPHPYKTHFVTLVVATPRTAILVSSPKCPLCLLNPLKGCRE